MDIFSANLLNYRREFLIYSEYIIKGELEPSMCNIKGVRGLFFKVIINTSNNKN